MQGLFALGLLLVAYSLTVNKRRKKQINILSRSIDEKNSQITILLEKLHALENAIKGYER